MPDPRLLVMTIRNALVPRRLHVWNVFGVTIWMLARARDRERRLTFRLRRLSLDGVVLKPRGVCLSSSSRLFLFGRDGPVADG